MIGRLPVRGRRQAGARGGAAVQAPLLVGAKRSAAQRAGFGGRRGAGRRGGSAGPAAAPPDRTPPPPADGGRRGRGGGGHAPGLGGRRISVGSSSPVRVCAGVCSAACSGVGVCAAAAVAGAAGDDRPAARRPASERAVAPEIARRACARAPVWRRRSAAGAAAGVPGGVVAGPGAGAVAGAGAAAGPPAGTAAAGARRPARGGGGWRGDGLSEPVRRRLRRHRLGGRGGSRRPRPGSAPRPGTASRCAAGRRLWRAGGVRRRCRTPSPPAAAAACRCGRGSGRGCAGCRRRGGAGGSGDRQVDVAAHGQSAVGAEVVLAAVERRTARAGGDAGFAQDGHGLVLSQGALQREQLGVDVPERVQLGDDERVVALSEAVKS